MEKEIKPNGFADIAELIREEKEVAVEAFRRGGFPARLEAEIVRRDRLSRRQAAPLRRPVFRLASGALVLAAMYLIISNIRPSSPAGKTIFEIALGPISNLEEPAGPGIRPAGKAMEFDPGLAALRDSIFKGFGRVQADDGTATAAPASVRPAPSYPRLTPEERLEMLFREKVIRRGLMLYRDNDKEVSQCVVNSSAFSV